MEKRTVIPVGEGTDKKPANEAEIGSDISREQYFDAYQCGHDGLCDHENHKEIRYIRFRSFHPVMSR